MFLFQFFKFLDKSLATFYRLVSGIVQNNTLAENDYNLNIPRYVDTFEEEEPVDLAAVARELKSLDAEMAQLDAQIRDYCAQLGIESPF